MLCIICGDAIVGVSVDHFWLREHRIVYSSFSGAGVTGVGCYDDEPSPRAPADPNAHWRNASADTAFEVIPVNVQREKEGRHGFILHDSCWNLLIAASQPRSICIPRLLEVCQSVPFPIKTYRLGWFHCYGGVLELEHRRPFRWQEAYSIAGSSGMDHVPEDPFKIPELEELVDSMTADQNESSQFERRTTSDCFTKLPWELREAIAVLLRTNDALNLRQASASFWPLMSSNPFWASRFAQYGERSFILEARQKFRGSRNWLNLYRTTSSRCNIDALRNRRRIWKLVQLLTAIVETKYERSDPTTGPRIAEPDTINQTWNKTTGIAFTDEDIKERKTFEVGCVTCHSDTVAMPRDLLKIGISILRFEESTYVTGIRMLTRSNVDIRFGFVGHDEKWFATTAVRGFRIAQAPSGLRAIRVAGRDGNLSPWFGNADGFPVTDRLMGTRRRIAALTIDTDEFKVVGLGVALREHKKRIATDMRRDIQLGSDALWYPTLPPSGTFHNDATYVGHKPSKTQYQPQVWTHFGGHGGKDLDHLCEISVECLYNINSLEFVYDRRFPDGQNKKTLRFHNKVDESWAIRQKFKIDGAGGERIESFDVGLSKMEIPHVPEHWRHGYPVSLKAVTNRGRSFEIRCKTIRKNENIRIEALRATEGTTITGLYGALDVQDGLVGLGVISESL